MHVKIDRLQQLNQAFKDKNPEEIKKLLLETFPSQYGLYKSESGKMFIEIVHDRPDGDTTTGNVIWRKGIVGRSELEENEILTREQAIPRFIHNVQKGYERAFEAVYEADLKVGKEKAFNELTEIEREGILGTYYKGKNFWRFSKYLDKFMIETGYEYLASNLQADVPEYEVRMKIKSVIAEGYSKGSLGKDEVILNDDDIINIGLGIEVITKSPDDIEQVLIEGFDLNFID